MSPCYGKLTNSRGKHTLRLKVTANRRTKNYCLKYLNKNIELTQEEFEEVFSLKPKGEFRSIKETVESSKARAYDAVEVTTRGGRPFSHERFEKEFFADHTKTCFLDYFNKYLNDLSSQGRMGTYRSYLGAYKVLTQYLTRKKINEKAFTAYDITYEFLMDLQKFLLESRGKTTLGIYARTYRTIYNYCAAQDYQLKELYPFGKGLGKFKILNTKNGRKRGDALTAVELKKFMMTKPNSDSAQYYAKLIWLFSFYCQGMNFKDICLLKYSNIKGQVIRYIREKTKRIEEEVIEISLSEQIRDIIVKIGNPDKSPDAYLFEILPAYESDPEIIEYTVMDKLKLNNKALKRLCLANDLPVITTYWSRHTYASLLKFSGVSVEMIRELLGHSDVRTTEHYLRRFDLLAKREINNRLYDHIMSIAS